MHLFLRHKTNLIAAADALPGRDRVDAGAGAPRRARHPARAAVPRGPRDRRASASAASGAPSAKFWEAPGVYTTAVGYAGGYTPNPTYEEVCSGAHRPHRGRARRLRPAADQLRGAAEGVLGGPRPDPGDAPGQRRRHPVPLGDLHARPTRSATAAEASRDAFQERAERAPATARSRPRSRPPASSTTPRTTTSSTSAKNPNGYCGLGGTGV